MKFEIVVLCTLLACQQTPTSPQKHVEQTTQHKSDTLTRTYDTTTRTIHVFVALCDNQYQGIIPVPDKLGNGRNPKNNLYWGAGYGISTFFTQSKLWKLCRTYAPNDSMILQRQVFRHRIQPNTFMIADAYIGQYIKTCTEHFLLACAGAQKDTLHINDKVIGASGNARLVAYIGHDGLMEFSADGNFNHRDTIQRQSIILACASKNFFAPYLKQTGAYPLLWTQELMCPEAYTLHDALEAYLNHQSNKEIRQKAAAAYAKYQRCTVQSAQKILVTGW